MRLARRSKISIHAPRTGSDGDTSQPRRLGSISIHAPRTGSDHYLRSGRLYASRFQSTLPARGATPVLSGRVPVLIYFNPRSPHGERRSPAPCAGDSRCNFNPRSPHGERRTLRNLVNIVNSFQSTLPARGATSPSVSMPSINDISIHAPRTGSDRVSTISF